MNVQGVLAIGANVSQAFFCDLQTLVGSIQSYAQLMGSRG